MSFQSSSGVPLLHPMRFYLLLSKIGRFYSNGLASIQCNGG